MSKQLRHAGSKFAAFARERIDLDEYVKNPEKFLQLEELGKEMLCYLLANRLEEITENELKKLYESTKYYQLLRTVKEHDMESLFLVCRIIKRVLRESLLDYPNEKDGFEDTMNTLKRLYTEVTKLEEQSFYESEAIEGEPEEGEKERVPVSA